MATKVLLTSILHEQFFFSTLGVYLVEIYPRKTTQNDFIHVGRGSIVPFFPSITGQSVECYALFPQCILRRVLHLTDHS